MGTSIATKLTLAELLAHTRDGVFVIDSNRRFVIFNQACEKLTGYAAADVLGTDSECRELHECEDEHGRSMTGYLCPGPAVLRGEIGSALQRMRIKTWDGRSRWVETIYTPISREDGTPEYVIGVMRDITEAREHEGHWHRKLEDLHKEVNELHRQIRERYGFASIATRSPVMQMVLEHIWSACSNSGCVLLTGEAGVGKETVARMIHANGLQKDANFVPFSGAGMTHDRIDTELFGATVGPEGRETTGNVRAADGGTLFLDDVDNLPAATQIRLLRAIEERCIRPTGGVEPVPVSFRVIAATRGQPSDLIAAGRLHEALAYRLGALTIEVPPLRDRIDDIPLLVDHFLDRMNHQGTRQVTEVDPDVWTLLRSHDWPGNLRELQNVIDSAYMAGHGPTLRPQELSFPARRQPRSGESVGASLNLDEALADVERRVILRALQETRGQRSLAAKIMGISRSRLYRRMDALGITREDEQQPI